MAEYLGGDETSDASSAISPRGTPIRTPDYQALRPRYGRAGSSRLESIRTAKSSAGTRAAKAVLRRLDTSAETGGRAGSAPRRFAPAVRVGLPANRSLSNDFNGLGRTPNVCKRMSSRLQKLSTVPLYELDAVMCTDPGGQQA